MSKEILDIETAIRLKNFNFRTSTKVRAYRSGIHKSSYHGMSPDFMDHKEYNSGDELKQIDWRLYGRHDRLYVKKFEDEVNLNWCILVDSSASMGYGDGSSNKLNYAKTLSATLAYLLLKQGDAVGLSVFSDEGIDLIPPKSGSSKIAPILNRLENIHPSGRTGLKEPVLKTLEAYRSDATFILVSDFLVDVETIEQTVKLIKNSKKELSLFHVLHPDETEFNFSGSIEFEDMETNFKVIADTNSIRQSYRKRVYQFIEDIRHICHENESRYVPAPTNEPIEKPIIHIADK
jgi:uncharacterized protein (DUF58 family)